MIKTFGKITLAGILAAMVMGVPLRISAADTNKPTATAPAKPHGSRFMGKLSAVDSTAKTITIENKTMAKRTFEITSDTKITKDSKPATLGDGVVGEDVSGTYGTNSADGKLVAKTLHFGKAAPAKKPAPAN